MTFHSQYEARITKCHSIGGGDLSKPNVISRCSSACPPRPHISNRLETILWMDSTHFRTNLPRTPKNSKHVKPVQISVNNKKNLHSKNPWRR